MAQPHTRYDNFKFPAYRFREYPKQVYRAVKRELMIDEMDDAGKTRARKHTKPVIECVNVPNSAALKQLGKEWLAGPDGHAKALTMARKMGERGELIRMITIEQFEDLTQEAQEIEEAEEQIIAAPEGKKKARAARPKGATARRIAKEAAQAAAE